MMERSQDDLRQNMVNVDALAGDMMPSQSQVRQSSQKQYEKPCPSDRLRGDQGHPGQQRLGGRLLAPGPRAGPDV